MSSKVVGREQCPKCLDSGSDNLARYIDGSSHCFSCGFHEGVNGMAKELLNIPKTIPNTATGWRTRGISKEAMDRFNVHRIASDELELQADGTHEPKATSVLMFPYYDATNGEMVGYKTRDIKKEKKEGIRWYGDPSRASLFGIGSQPKAATTCVIVEGEPDVLALASVAKDVAVFGLQGCDEHGKNAVTYVKKAYTLLNSYKRIVLMLDNDKVGQGSTQALIGVLPKAKLFTAQLPSNYKDVGEMVQDGLTKEVASILRNASQVQPPAIANDEELLKSFDDAYNGIGNAAGIPYGFPSLDEASGGMHGGELITIVAGTGAGKSTFTEKIALNIAEAGESVFFCPLEMLPTQVLQKMVQHKSGLPVARPGFERNEYTDKKMSGVPEAIVERVKFMSHFGGMDIDTFLANCEAAIVQHGVKVIIVDHLTALVTASAGGNNVFASDNITSKLKEFALCNNVTVICISHVSRDNGYDVENKVPQLKHLRGGNGIAQYSDMVIGLGRKRSEKLTDVETIKVHRMVGEHRAFKLNYEHYTLKELSEGDDINDETSSEEDIHEERDVRQSTRVQSTTSVPRTDTPPRQEPVVHDNTRVPSGLYNTEGNGGGSEGLFQPRGQNQDENIAYAVPISRLGDGIRFTPGDDKQS